MDRTVANNNINNEREKNCSHFAASHRFSRVSRMLSSYKHSCRAFVRYGKFVRRTRQRNQCVARVQSAKSDKNRKRKYIYLLSDCATVLIHLTNQRHRHKMTKIVMKILVKGHRLRLLCIAYALKAMGMEYNAHTYLSRKGQIASVSQRIRSYNFRN